MAFAPGQSGNPGGRSKEAAAIKRFAESKCMRAIEQLAKIMETSEDEKNVIAASNALLDRGLGKPQQSITGGGENGEFEVTQKIAREVVRPAGS